MMDREGWEPGGGAVAARWVRSGLGKGREKGKTKNRKPPCRNGKEKAFARSLGALFPLLSRFSAEFSSETVHWGKASGI